MVWEWRLADGRRTGRNLYGDEAIPPQPPAEKTPKLLRAMRALVKTSTNFWQSRSELFLKQARLMANYEDDYDYRGTVNQYFPTYDSLTDPELRGYFTWRTKVRRGAVERRGMSYAALYVYELLALVGCTSPMDAYERLHSFGQRYGALDPQILRYLKDWERALIIYYGLSPALLEEHDGAVQQRRQDDAVYVMLHQEEHTPEEMMAAVCTLSSYRLERSKLYRAHTAEADAIVLRVLARVKEYYEKHRICDFFSDCIARSCTRSVDLFASAVFHPPRAEEDRIYAVHPLRQYECTGGAWPMSVPMVRRSVSVGSCAGWIRSCASTMGSRRFVCRSFSNGSGRSSVRRRQNFSRRSARSRHAAFIWISVSLTASAPMRLSPRSA